jgi:hypothetical protein
MNPVAIAIELEASYQMWRSQHKRYLLLSRRAWLNDAAVAEGRNVEDNGGPGEVRPGGDFPV